MQMAQVTIGILSQLVCALNSKFYLERSIRTGASAPVFFGARGPVRALMPERAKQARRLFVSEQFSSLIESYVGRAICTQAICSHQPKQLKIK